MSYIFVEENLYINTFNNYLILILYIRVIFSEINLNKLYLYMYQMYLVYNI